MNWKRGDHATIVETVGHMLPIEYKFLLGEECILEYPFPCYHPHPCWIINVQGDDSYATCERGLKPIPPPHEIAEWDEKIFVPNKETINIE